MSRSTWRLPVVGLLTLFALAYATPRRARAQAACTSKENQVPAPPLLSNGITCVDWRSITDRLYEVTMQTDKIFDQGARIEIKARVLFPQNYLANPSTRYRVLYLLHGGTGTYVDWSRTKEETDADFPLHLDGGRLEALTSGHNPPPSDFIFVMPEGGRAGWYSDWHGYTDGGFRPLWESYHIEQLVPWVDASFRTIGTRASRSIAGLSMGGLGAAKYAANHSELFEAVGLFSGGVDITDEAEPDQLFDGNFIISNSMWIYGASVDNYGLDVSEGSALFGYRNTHPEVPAAQEEFERMKDIFGPPDNNTPEWLNQNPTAMPKKFEPLRVAIYTGRSYDWWDRGESDIARLNDNFQDALISEQVPHRFCTGVGTHSFHYWRADLVDFLYFLEGDEDRPCPCPDADNIRDWNPLNDYACWENWGVQQY